VSRLFLLLLLLFLPALDDVLRDIEAKGRDVADFRARFRQEKSVYLLDEPLRSEGTILYKREPALLRWETTSPERSTLVIDGSGMKVHMPGVKQLEVYEFSGKDAFGAILPLFGQGTEDLRRSYEVTLATGTADVHTLELVPRAERLRRVISKLEVSIDKKTLLPRRLAYHDPNGDVSTTVFESVEPNVGLSEKDFKLDVPEGTKTVKPLRGLPF
jgi:outer membrane lipoprotein-sorting protein